MTHRFGRRSILAASTAGAAGLVGLAAGCSGTSEEPEATGADDPEATGGADAAGQAPALADTPSAEPDEQLTGLLTRYGDESGQWSGADSTYSVVMPDGSIAWIFSDTFLGPVESDGSRAEDTPFLHNSIVVQAAPDSEDLRTIHSTNDDGQPAAAVPSTEDDAWNWLGAGIVGPDGNLQVITLSMEKTGDGILDFAWRGTGIATLDLTTGTVLERADLPSGAEIQWSAWLQPSEDGATVHVYGVRDGETKTLHVARVASADLADADAWEFWTGQEWGTEESEAAVIAENVANELSVTPFEGEHLLITQDTSIDLNPQVVAMTSTDPTGPFAEPVELFTMAEAGPDGSYGNENVYGYNAHEHPWLREGRELVISYNVNSLRGEDLYEDASIYRPRFMRVSL